MFIYKIKIRYSNNLEEVKEIKSENKKIAEQKTLEIIKENKKYLDKLKSKNVYVSKHIVMCELQQESLKKESERICEMLNLREEE